MSELAPNLDARDVEFDDDPDRVDLDVLWAYLSKEAYWARWRDREQVEQQMRAAWRVVGAYRVGSGEMVGFARAMSDGFGVAWLADVFVVAEAQGLGVGSGLVDTMIEQGPGRDFCWVLHTADAHHFYERFGFAAPGPTTLERPGRYPEG
jgi:GNAT superfamily N-acetyltransferase